VHQPLRLDSFNYFDIAKGKNYFTPDNRKILKKVAAKCYYPANQTILEIIAKYPEFRAAYSLSGVLLDQCEQYEPKLLSNFQQLVKTRKVELLNETYYHSLSYLFSKSEFIEQVLMHRRKIYELFKKKAQIFRNTELIYSNRIAEFARQLGYKAILAEGWEKYLHWRSPNFVYNARHEELGTTYKEMLAKKRFTETIEPEIRLLLKNYKLSDDIAFRFGDRTWSGFPLTAEKFADWVEEVPGNTVNLFMDYETFGEHQWQDTGIFKFMQSLPRELLKRGISFKTPSETIASYPIPGDINVPNLLSWADMERDLSAWMQNRMQNEALKKIFEIRKLLQKLEHKLPDKTKVAEIYKTWRYLQTSDHFYYMSTKYWSDGDIHAYFSPYDSPYDAYINYMNVLNDFRQTLLTMK
jgi:alpha-amylase